MDMKALYSFKENHMQYLESLLSRINSYFWDGPMLIVLSLFHLYFTVHTRCVQRKEEALCVGSCHTEHTG